MITVKIPKDIREYQGKFIGDFSLRQIISIVAAVVLAALVVFLTREGLNLETIVQDLGFIGIPFTLPVIIFGFVQVFGMSSEQIILKIVKFAKSKKSRSYCSENFFHDLEEEYDKEYGADEMPPALKRRASFERAFLLAQAREKGVDIDIQHTPLVTVKMPQSKKPKDDRNEKKKRLSKAGIQLLKVKATAEKIIQTQKDDPQYIFTKQEHALVSKYNILQDKFRKEQIKAGAKKTETQNDRMSKRRHVPTVIPDTVQKTLPYIADYDGGLFEVERNVYNKMYELNDVNFSSMRAEEQENLVAKYSEFLNYFSEDILITVSLDNRIISKDEQESRIFYRQAGDGFDMHRKEYNRIMRRQIESGRNNIILSKYMTATIKCGSPIEAMEQFHKIDNDVLTGLDRVGAGGRTLSTNERLHLLHDRFRRGREGELKIDYDFIKFQGISSKDYIAPASLFFGNNYFMIEEEYCRCMFLSNLPGTLDDSFFMELADNDFPTTVTMMIQPVAQDKALKMVRNRKNDITSDLTKAQKRATKSGYSPDIISHTLRQNFEEAEELFENMTRKSQKMFYITFVIMISAPTYEELQKRYQTLQGKARKQTSQIMAMYFDQESAFKSCVPGGTPSYKLCPDRALTSDATAIFVPYSCQEMFHTGGFYYGINRISRNLIMIDRANKLDTPSGFILGSSGSGKSFAAKREMLNVLLHDPRTPLLIIDPENEYGEYIETFGGLSLSISAGTDNFVNPMEMTAGYGLDENDDSKNISIERKKEKALKSKSEYIMSIVQCMMEKITPQQKTIVDRCVKKCYKKYLDNDFDVQYLPTLLDLQLYFDEEAKDSIAAQQIAQATEYYTRGSLDVFSPKSNVDLTKRAIAFNIRDLGEQLKQIALLIVLDFIWNKMIENSERGYNTYCYVDEIHVLFRNEYSAKFLQQLYKRGRKYGLVITGITQDIDDLLKSESARGMINNSDFLLLLNQSSENVKTISELLQLSEVQKEFINEVERGSGLIRASKVIVPFIDRFPSDSYLYDLMSTNFAEKAEQKRIDELADNPGKFIAAIG